MTTLQIGRFRNDGQSDVLARDKTNESNDGGTEKHWTLDDRHKQSYSRRRRRKKKGKSFGFHSPRDELKTFVCPVTGFHV